MDVKPSLQKTERGLIPKDWHLRRVSEIATTVASGRSRVDSEFGDYPVYGSTGVIGRCVRGDYSGKAILVARVGANAGKLAVVDGSYGVTDNTIILRTGGSCDLNYFWRQLESKRLNSLVFGSGQPLITGTQIKNLSVPVPPTKTEQEAIAEALSDADALIESLEQLIAKKHHIKQGAMQELLTGKKRLPGFATKDGFKQTEMGMIPADWEVADAGSLGRFRGGNGFPTVYQGSSSGEYPFFKVSDMNNEGNETFMETANNYISEATRSRMGANVFPPGTIVFAKGGSRGFFGEKKDSN